MLDGRVLEASQVEYKPFGKPPLQREGHRSDAQSLRCRARHGEDGNREAGTVDWAGEKNVSSAYACPALRLLGTPSLPTRLGDSPAPQKLRGWDKLVRSLQEHRLTRMSPRLPSTLLALASSQRR